jgi:uncharacterized protein
MAEIDPEYTVTNESRNCTIATRVRLASTSRTRRKGLLGVRYLDENSGLWIVPCEAVHTFGMSIPIDVLFVDRKNQVKKIRPNLKPGRISFSLTARSVLELAVGSIEKSGTQVGDRLLIERNQESLLRS